jgi:tRNA-splicing ligase RtcB
MSDTITLSGITLLRRTENSWEIPKGGGMRVEGRVYASERMLQDLANDRAVEQVRNVAHLPGILGCSIGMPDIHWGYGFPIGGVAATDWQTGVISPGGVGYDINCGVRLLRTNLSKEEVMPKIAALIAALFNAIPTGVGSEGAAGKISLKEIDRILENGVGEVIKKGFGDVGDQERIEQQGVLPWADADAVSAHAKERGSKQLGSLGSGNHFLEVQIVEEIFDEGAAKAFGLGPKMITVMIHSGSRGLGYQVCDDAVHTFGRLSKEKYGIDLPDRQLCSVPIHSPEGQQYFSAMAAAAHFAWSNRQVMTEVTRRVFQEVFKKSPAALGIDLIYDVCHNIAKKEEYDVPCTEGGAMRRVEVCVHRKGATRAFPPGHPDLPDIFKPVGQPVLIPGDMGRASYVLKGTDKAMRETFGSSCHGAGRVMSRTESKKRAGQMDVFADLKERGIEIMAHGRATIAEEMPHAYKDVSEVVEVMHQEGISLKVAKLKPIGVIKG